MLYADLPHSLKISSDLLLTLYDAAVECGRQTQKRSKRRPSTQRHPGQALLPGADTPLWNELVAQAQPWILRRGSQAQLGRLLGVPRQRVHACLKARKACLDTERALLLLCWIAARRQGHALLA